ncbi:hypothetical protein WN55_03762 [Dufourea novaeangliae]|uniref:Uncharacterized protein n=1 Tax=Dufourea novaeangliae TaxID=178035 RepID=A0A154PLT6_DUFNO|nr:hypothetical protein WN55_03762 [Dufourea novaeangliae]
MEGELINIVNEKVAKIVDVLTTDFEETKIVFGLIMRSVYSFVQLASSVIQS